MKIISDAKNFIEENEYNSVEELRKNVLVLLDYELEGDIIFKNLSYCLIPLAFDHFKNEKDPKKRKTKCNKCAYLGFCNGYYKSFEKFVSPVLDLPKEIVIEVTDKCNHNCSFCFNSLVYGVEERNNRPELSTKDIKKIIEKIAKSGVKVLRFSGGEPFLREDIHELIHFAKSKKLDVWLNTNGTVLSSSDLNFINKNISNILIPLNGYDELSDSKITGLKNSFSKKLSVFHKLKDVRIKRAGVVLIEDNINNLEKFYELLNEIPITFLEFYRPITTSNNKKLMKKAIDKIYKLNLKYKKNVKIANAFPFCFYKPEISKKICLGGIFDDGNTRFVIGSDGIAKPSYYLSKNIGNALTEEILDIWNNPFLKSLRNLELLPEVCNNCEHKLTCRGGSKSLAEITHLEKDPLI